jgi:two-component system, cell cycle sensor histidine kinase PleC
LINDILDLSKVEAGAMDFELQPVALRDLFEQARSQVAPLAQRAAISLQFKSPRKLAVTADPIRLKQVLLNLASNAIKFTPPAGRVTVFAAGRPGWVDISVRDTGIGISPEQLSQVFEPFVQVDHERVRRSAGTGLGLALSRGLVERMGGQLRATSTPGQGSLFTISLPAPMAVQRLRARAPREPAETAAV